jgi:hypothetical protein
MHYVRLPELGQLFPLFGRRLSLSLCNESVKKIQLLK